MKFSMRDLGVEVTAGRSIAVRALLLICAAFTVPGANAAEDRKLSIHQRSFWVVTGSYEVGRPSKDSVGQGVVFANGHLHLISPNDGVRSLVLKAVKGADGERFELFEDDRLVAGGLLVRDGKSIRFYVNQVIRGTDKVIPPEARVDKCDQVFVCSPITEAEGKARLAVYGKVP